MNYYEATRYVHKLIADTLANEFTHTSASDYPWTAGRDAPKVRRVLDHWIELHRRRGPLATDRAPRELEYRGEKLPLEDPTDAEKQTGCEAGSGGIEPAVDVAQAARADGGGNVGRAATAGVASGGESGEGSVRVDATRNAAGQVIARPNITDAGQHYMVAPPGDREPMRLMFADDDDIPFAQPGETFGKAPDDIDEALQPLDARAHCGDGDSAAREIVAPRCDVLRVTAAGVFVCTLPQFHADSMNATPHAWQELDTCSARRLRDDGMWRCIKSNGHIDEHEWRKEQP